MHDKVRVTGMQRQQQCEHATPWFMPHRITQCRVAYRVATIWHMRWQSASFDCFGPTHPFAHSSARPVSRWLSLRLDGWPTTMATRATCHMPHAVTPQGQLSLAIYAFADAIMRNFRTAWKRGAWLSVLSFCSSFEQRTGAGGGTLFFSVI